MYQHGTCRTKDCVWKKLRSESAIEDVCPQPALSPCSGVGNTKNHSNQNFTNSNPRIFLKLLQSYLFVHNWIQIHILFKVGV